MADRHVIYTEQADREIAEALRNLHQTPKPHPQVGRDAPREWMPPILGVLLENLYSYQTVPAAVLGIEEVNEIQVVTINGFPDAINGRFRLQWNPLGLQTHHVNEDGSLGEIIHPNFQQTVTGWIPVLASVIEFEQALLEHPEINQGDVAVTLGNFYRERDGNEFYTRRSGMYVLPKRWFVEFRGRYAGQDVPRMNPTQYHEAGESAAYVGVGGSAYLEVFARGPSPTFRSYPKNPRIYDTGRRENVTCMIPVGFPSPLNAGAIFAAIHFPGIGYVPIAVEARELIGNSSFLPLAPPIEY